jgi:serine/threonine-protein kinase
VLASRGPLPIEEAVDHVLEALDAVAQAHAHGIIHRDLKPANLFLEQRSNNVRRVKVLDFGVSKSLLEAQKSMAALTQTANLVGSPLYMSPEQLESSRDVDARADIWGLGVVLYELIAGVPPFAAASIPQLIAAVITERPRRFSEELRPQVPAELEAVIQRTLSKDRRDRTASVEALMEELEPFAGPLTTASGRTTQLSASEPRSGKGASLRSPTQTTQTPLSWDRDDKASPSRTRWAIGAVLFALVAAGALYAYSAFQEAEPGIAKPLPQADDGRKPEVGAATHNIGEPEPAEIPRGVAPDVPALDPTGAPGASGTLQPAAADQNVNPAELQPVKTAPQPTAAKPRSAQVPVVNPVPIAKPAAPPPPAAHGAPPRGQVTNFGGRR